jgi:uncharacterized membrane protein
MCQLYESCLLVLADNDRRQTLFKVWAISIYTLINKIIKTILNAFTLNGIVYHNTANDSSKCIADINKYKTWKGYYYVWFNI